MGEVEAWKSKACLFREEGKPRAGGGKGSLPGVFTVSGTSPYQPSPFQRSQERPCFYASLLVRKDVPV
jgi:hypothetical protein